MPDFTPEFGIDVGKGDWGEEMVSRYGAPKGPCPQERATPTMEGAGVEVAPHGIEDAPFCELVGQHVLRLPGGVGALEG